MIVTRRGSSLSTVTVTSETLDDPMRAATRFKELVHSQTAPGEYVVNTTVEYFVPNGTLVELDKAIRAAVRGSEPPMTVSLCISRMATAMQAELFTCVCDGCIEERYKND